MYYHFPHKYHQQAQAQYTFYFWPSINGTASTDGAMTTALHQNNATVVTSRTQIFTVAANDYLEVNYMIDNIAGFFKLHSCIISSASYTILNIVNNEDARMNEELERCKPWIEAALEYSGGTHDFIDVAEGIYKGGICSCGLRQRGCIVTEIVVYPRKRMLNVFLRCPIPNALATLAVLLE